MREDFIHYLWKHKMFDVTSLKTTTNRPIFIQASGQHNHNSGPDFFNAQLKIGEQLWAGNIEIHLKSSDWFAHNHESDKAYDNVILHVVWDHDTEIFRKDNSEIDTLELSQYVSNKALNNYQRLFRKPNKWINCETDFPKVDDFLLENWTERLYFERLERKADEIIDILESNKNNWEAVLFKMITKNFGLKVNGESFLSLAKAINFSVVRKERINLKQIEALLFGHAGLLEQDVEEVYFKELKDLYAYQRHKYKLSNQSVLPMQFFRLRPPNFPTIRLAQLANLYYINGNLFSELMTAKSIDAIYKIFDLSTSNYWATHYNFGRSSKKLKKQITTQFVDLLIINTIIPLKFCYAKHQGKSIDHEIISMISNLRLEQNNIVDKFQSFNKAFNTALHSQALIQLKTNYCDKNKCLQCAIGNTLLSQN